MDSEEELETLNFIICLAFNHSAIQLNGVLCPVAFTLNFEAVRFDVWTWMAQSV
jgi:hypothetical protein